MSRLATNLCNPINASAIAQNVGLRDNERVNDRIHDLVTGFLAWRCYKAQEGEVPNTAAQRKVYFVDPLIAQLPHRRNVAFPVPDQTRLSEQQLGLALNRAVSLDRPSAFVDSDRVMYVRFQKNSEVDFLGPEFGIPFD